MLARYQQIAITNASEPTPISVDPTSVHLDPLSTYDNSNDDVPANIATPATANFTGDRVGCDDVSAVVDVQAGSADLLTAEPELGTPLPGSRAEVVE